MTILTDHININRERDPGYWYIWTLSFQNTFRKMHSDWEEYFKSNSFPIFPKEPGSLPDSLVMWVIYSHTLELFFKTYLLSINAVTLEELKLKYKHDLELLRKKCQEYDNRFDYTPLKWITQDIRRFSGIDWEYLKYPPKRTALKSKSKEKSQTIPSIYDRDIMILPLDLLLKVVSEKVYVKD